MAGLLNRCTTHKYKAVTKPGNKQQKQTPLNTCHTNRSINIRPVFKKRSINQFLWALLWDWTFSPHADFPATLFFHEVFPGTLNQPVMGKAEQSFSAADPQVCVQIHGGHTQNVVPEKPGTCPHRCGCDIGQQLDSGWTDTEVVKIKTQTSQMPHAKCFLRPSSHHLYHLFYFCCFVTSCVHVVEWQ